MSHAFQRGMVLYAQDRFDLADREFRKGLSEEPDDPVGHAYLALCLARQKRNDEALREANEAVRLAPDLSFVHHVRGGVLFDQDRYLEAEAAVGTAIQLDPHDAGNFGLMAAIKFARRLWPEALNAAEKGLQIDPEHPGCTNFRALALVKLGRKDEAGHALHSALANDPENALTHANQGWAYLHRGDHARALEHFREALRIDPELEWAQTGIVEALKARHLVYRLMLRFFLWMDRLSQSAQWTVLLLFIFGRNILASLAEAQPTLAPFIAPVLSLTFGFLLLTWIASPLFDFFLMFNRFGRLALPAARKAGAVVIGLCFFAAVAGFVLNLIRDDDASFLVMTYFGLMLIPLAVAFRRPPGRSRYIMAAAVVLIALLGFPALAQSVLGQPLGIIEPARAEQWFVKYFVAGCILSGWLPLLIDRRPDVR